MWQQTPDSHGNLQGVHRAQDPSPNSVPHDSGKTRAIHGSACGRRGNLLPRYPQGPLSRHRFRDHHQRLFIRHVELFGFGFGNVVLRTDNSIVTVDVKAVEEWVGELSALHDMLSRHGHVEQVMTRFKQVVGKVTVIPAPVGSNLRSSSPAIWHPWCKGSDCLVPGERIELPTNGLQNRCSTAELTRLPYSPERLSMAVGCDESRFATDLPPFQGSHFLSLLWQAQGPPRPSTQKFLVTAAGVMPNASMTLLDRATARPRPCLWSALLCVRSTPRFRSCGIHRNPR